MSLSKSFLYYWSVLNWEKTNLPQASKINRRVMVDAALAEKKKLVSALYNFEYRIDVDFQWPFIQCKLTIRNMSENLMRLWIHQKGKRMLQRHWPPRRNILIGKTILFAAKLLKEEHEVDHVNKCRLFEAASCITYLAVAFEATTDDEVEEYDPLERSFELARRTKTLALEHQV